MKKNHFFIGYAGNKRKEVERIYQHIKLDNIDTIVEPFCGTSAMSYYIWLNNKNKDLTYVLNDNNKFLIELYEIAKDIDKFKTLYNSLLKLQEETTNKEKYTEVCKKSKTDLVSYIYINKVYNIRAGLYPTGKAFTKDSWKVFFNAPIIDFLRNAKVKIMNKDALEVYKEFKDNSKALIFIDPPYLSSVNSFYKTPSTLIYEYLFENDIDKEKANIILCLENIWIIKLLFKGKKSIIYDKKYEPSKKKTEHIIIMNK